MRKSTRASGGGKSAKIQVTLVNFKERKYALLDRKKRKFH